MYIMTSRPGHTYSIQAPFGGVTDWYPEPRGTRRTEVMAALVISISSDVLVKSLDTHSSSEVDPSESSPPPVFVAPMVSPFLYSDDLESDTEIPKRHVSPTTSTLEISIAPILPAPSAVVAPSSEFLLHLALTARNSVRPLPSYRLALRTPWCSEAYLYWRSAPLSTMYPLTTSESSVRDSSSKSSVEPSRKRCRSLAATVTSSIHAMRDLVPSHIEADATADEVAVDRDVEVRVDAGIGMEVDVGVDVEEEVEESDRGTMEVGVDVVAEIDIPDEKIPLQRIEDIETGQKELEARNDGSYEATRAANALEADSQSQNGNDGDNGNGGDGNGVNGNPNENNMGVRPVA
ncbi:hypothetical protein Tco_0696184 [Tanacetum coccineum]